VSQRLRRRSILVTTALALLFPGGAASAIRPLELGFFDPAFTGPSGPTWLGRGAAAGADLVRIEIGWVAPDTLTRPPSFDARNPADPAYGFTGADAAIRYASELGLRVIVSFTGAPRWAEGPGRPAGASPGTWRPDPHAVEDYAVALATRYSGNFPDPVNPGHMLPRVTAFQLWNEPNMSEYLTPQWSGNRPAAPAIYRAMLNAFYRGVKSVDPQALVVTAGTGPFGDPQVGGPRLQPALFWRGVLCLQATGTGGLARTSCRNPAHFDVLAHHPYAWGSPTTTALWPDDVAIPDLGKLTRLLGAAERFGTLLPHRHHSLWVTEVGYNTNPPNPGGVPVGEDARWVEQTLEVLWSQGVSVVAWNQVGDQPPDPSYSVTNQSGLYYLDGRPKPALTAFRFPLVAWQAGGRRVDVWGRAPAAGRLVIERRVRSSWRPLWALRVTAHTTFLVQIAARGYATLRARVGRETSLAWSLG
jgi:hypothetical protein